MATYAIGDLQGCYDPLVRLLDELQFDPSKDTLWLVGDLVCRGSQSLETLQFIKSLGDSAKCVLGNHDISLIASHYGLFKPHSSLKKLMKSPDRDELIHWLRHQPLLHIDYQLGHCMVHAGISPAWNLSEAKQYAEEIETILKTGDNLRDWLENMYHNKPKRWKTTLSDDKRQRYIINSFTRMRYCNVHGKLNFKQKLSPNVVQQRKPHLMPWFDVPNRSKIDLKIVFGHWSTLGFYDNNQVVALDTGCVWSGELTAYQIDAVEDKKKRYSIQCR